MNTFSPTPKNPSNPNVTPQQKDQGLLNIHFLVMIVILIFSVICSIVWIANSDHTTNSIFAILFLILTFDCTVIGVIYGNSRIDEKLERLNVPSNWPNLPGPVVTYRLSKIRLYITLLFLIMTLASSSFVGFGPPPPSFCNPHIHNTSCIIHTTGENTVGLSNGVSAFDIKRKDGQLKLDAVNEYDAGNISTARISLQKAIAIDPTDAEARIDLENLRVLDSCPTWSIIVGADIVSDSTQWEATIQGAYTSQNHFNNSQDLPNNLKIVLLLANFGGNQALNVIRLIGQAAQADNHIIGIVDWPENTVTGKDMRTIEQMDLPVVLSTTESENMTGSYPYAFLVAATSNQEGTAGADFAARVLHSKNVVIVMGYNDPYSESLVKTFNTTLQTLNGTSSIATIPYAVGDANDMPHILNAALRYNPDLIYFAGDAHDINAFMNNPIAFATHPNFKVLSSDPVYDLPEYPQEANNRLYYTASAFEDMYRYSNLTQPEIFCKYTELFTQTSVGENCDQSKTYWKDRASSNTILAIDAMTLLVQAIKLAGYASLTPDAVMKALMSMRTAANPITSFQGVGGCIILGQDRKPIDKNVVVLQVDAHSDTQIVYREGCLTSRASVIMLTDHQH